MKIGVNYRNWGPHASRDNLLACAQIADESALDSIWVNDHIGFPADDWQNDYGVPNQMGDIIDPFAMMAALAVMTSRIEFGSGIVVAPYRPALPTAKWLQSIQHLSAERMLFGVGVGYLQQEFTALGVPRERRGKITDETLDILHQAFSGDPVQSHGQSLMLAPQTKRPPFLIGGAAEVAFPRALARGDGWIPVGILPDELAPLVSELQERAAEAGRSSMEVVVMKTLPLEEASHAVELAQAYREAGATHLVHTQGYDSPSEYREFVDQVAGEIRSAVQG